MKEEKNKFKKINVCPISRDKKPICYFSLGKIPLVNNYYDTQEESINAERYPINLNYFKKSGLSCLDCVVDPELLFSNYFFKSSVNIPYLEHCEEMFKSISKYFGEETLNICDIGGNDGGLLNSFRKISKNKENYYLNIDPSKNLTKICEEKNINVLSEFFSYELSKKIDKKFDIIVSTNVFQHLEDINSFVLGIKEILKDDGIWVLEFPYWIHDMITNQFDQIYHEHIYYYSIKPLLQLFNNNLLKIIRATKEKIHGGTIRLYITKSFSKYVIDSSVQDFLNNEKKYDLDYYLSWAEKINNHIIRSKKFLYDLKLQGKKIYGFGAAAKGCVFLNAMSIDKKIVEVIIDDTDLKQDKFIPGTDIQIKDRNYLKTNKPDYILILTHNFTDFIVNSLRDIYQGEFIVLVPEIKIINFNK